MNNISIQIQSTLYNTSLESFMRTLRSIQNAIQVSNKNGFSLSQVQVCFGDASDTKTLKDKEVYEIQNEFESDFVFSYNFFGFNSGSAKGHNTLAENCKTDFLLLMNPDILLCPRFFIEILSPFWTVDNVGIVEGRQTPVEHPKEYDQETGETSWASGACTFIKTELFHEVHGYDSDTFFMYCDDVDLSWRVKLLGKKVIYQPRAVVFHAKRLSQKGAWLPTEAELYYSTLASLYMQQKWAKSEQVNEFLKELSNRNDENAKKVVKEFNKRKKNNQLPKPVKNAELVATHVDSTYTAFRFVL